MTSNKSKRQREQENMMLLRFMNIVTAILLILFGAAFYLVMSFKPMTKEDQIRSYEKMNEAVDPFRKNLTECARQVKASMVDVENFLKRIPQSTMQGKCFVACILKRTKIIQNNKLVKKTLLDANVEIYGEDNEVIVRLQDAIAECTQAVDNIFEICEYASVFNDCMHMKMEHILDKVTMERRMEALGQMASNPDEWSDEEDEILKLVKDEL